jgi:hypothetical protein
VSDINLSSRETNVLQWDIQKVNPKYQVTVIELVTQSPCKWPNWDI